MKTLIAILFASVCFAQGPVINQTSGPPPEATRKLFFYDANNNLQYECISAQRGQTTTYTRAATTLTNIVVSSNTATMTTSSAHQLYPGAFITITGATVDTDLNATYKVLTTASPTTLTFTTVAVANATYTDAGLVVTTNEPLLNALKWSIASFVYDATNTGQLNATGWGLASVGGALACSDRAKY